MEQNLQQVELAELVGVRRETISALERGKYNPSLRLAMNIADVFQLTVEDIFEGEQHHPYTVGLFGAIPNMAEESPRLHPIDGLMPDPSVVLPGCPFAERCPHCQERCKESRPAPVAVNDGMHRVKCWLARPAANAVKEG